MKLVDYMTSLNKEDAYAQYEYVITKPKDYTQVTRKQMANEVLSYYEAFTETDFEMFFDYEEYRIMFQLLDGYYEINALDLPCYRLMNKLVCMNENELNSNDRNITLFEELYPILEKFVSKEMPSDSFLKNSERFFITNGLMFSQGVMPEKDLVIVLAELLNETENNIETWLDNNQALRFVMHMYENPTLFEDSPRFYVHHTIEDEFLSVLDAREALGSFANMLLTIDEYIILGKHQLSLFEPTVKDYVSFIFEQQFVMPVEEALLELFINMSVFTNDSENILMSIQNIYETFGPDDKQEEFIKKITEAFMHSVSPSLGGHTPISIMDELDSMDNTKQTDAHLKKEDADLFYKLYFALLEYTNNKYKINEELKRIYKQKRLVPNQLLPISKYLFEHRDIIDDFVDENPYTFTNEELAIVAGFKQAVTGFFTLYDFEETYAVIADEKHRYAVVGVEVNLDRVYQGRLPVFVQTNLLPFRNVIIYDGLLSELPIQMSSNVIDTLQTIDDLPLIKSFLRVMN
ncbi:MULTISPECIES: hypothetical protein [unclassified Breznakia]|uniref:hypothetical protein n=1 Tax=unclassified Breznakia TaxID=2623764 RepID=UPI0024764E1B|nr:MULTISPECIES: hypothetical protein [unclassified Breznakia]MDH6368044.1 hypothetical protein [Breznakia sp. PH1-1]MDH6405132.1 hypothetical protein [Breznakia sp. PF1-11]MDH6412847.1 hypothetical protein [Breznakia sp. PFB1-11]MDH6415211.1 hypothetical protein [Breznakia sp. PFB1-14]MDH6417521.1 hypothetical protein [Breznakia sp. PFB1-4]